MRLMLLCPRRERSGERLWKRELGIDLEVRRRNILTQDRTGVPEQALLIHGHFLVGGGQDGNIDTEQRVTRADVGVELFVGRRLGGCRVLRGTTDQRS